MLITSEKRYVPTAVNMIVLQDAEDRYYYMHRSLYDQCVILRDRYLELLPSFYKLLGMEDKHPVICDTFMEIVPEPIDILGPFLSLVTGCEELDSIEDMCGALSSMSMSVDFRRMFKVPMEIRQAVKFSLRVREEYRIQWDRFFMETPEFEVVQFARGIVLSGVYSDNDKVTTVDEGEDVNEYSGATIVDDGEEFDEEAYRAKFLADISGSKEVVKDAEEVAQASTQPSAFDLLRGIK